MRIIELMPSPTERVGFSRSEYRKVPQVSGCYVLATFLSDILYVGRTVNLHDRFQQHLDDPEKTQPTSDGKAIWFYYLPWEESGIEVLENTWLNDYEIHNGRLPILNKKRASIS